MVTQQHPTGDLLADEATVASCGPAKTGGMQVGEIADGPGGCALNHQCLLPWHEEIWQDQRLYIHSPIFTFPLACRPGMGKSLIAIHTFHPMVGMQVWHGLRFYIHCSLLTPP